MNKAAEAVVRDALERRAYLARAMDDGASSQARRRSAPLERSSIRELGTDAAGFPILERTAPDGTAERVRLVQRISGNAAERPGSLVRSPGAAGSFGSAIERAIDDALGSLGRGGFVGRYRLDLQMRALVNARPVPQNPIGSGVGAPIQNVVIPVGAMPGARVAELLPFEQTLAPQVQLTRIGVDQATAQAIKPTAQGDVKPTVPLKTSIEIVELPTYAGIASVAEQTLADVVGVARIVERVVADFILAGLSVDAWAVAIADGNGEAMGAKATAQDSLLAAYVTLRKRGADPVLLLPFEDWQAMASQKAEGSGVYLGLPIEEMRAALRPAEGLPAGKFLGTDARGRGLAIHAWDAVDFMLGLNGDDFSRNLRTLRVETRAAPLVSDPTLVVHGDLIAAGGA